MKAFDWFFLVFITLGSLVLLVSFYQVVTQARLAEQELAECRVGRESDREALRPITEPAEAWTDAGVDDDP